MNRLASQYVPTGEIQVRVSINGDTASLDHKHHAHGLSAKQFGFVAGMLLRYACEYSMNTRDCVDDAEAYDAGLEEAFDHDESGVEESYRMWQLPPKERSGG